MKNLTDAVAKSLDVTEQEADQIIDETANLADDMLSEGDLRYEDVEELMYDMGVEPDYMMKFLERLI